MGEVWPEAQAHVAAELGTDEPDAIVFAANTHDFLVRLWAAAPRRSRGPLRVLDQQRRVPQRPAPVRALGESGEIKLDQIAAEPFDCFADRFLERRGERAPRPYPRQPGPVRQRPHLRSRRAAAGSVGRRARGSSSTAITRSWRWTGRSAEAAGSAFYLGGGLQICDGRRRAARSCMRRRASARGRRSPAGMPSSTTSACRPAASATPRTRAASLEPTFDPSALYRFNAVQRMLAPTA